MQDNMCPHCCVLKRSCLLETADTHQLIWQNALSGFAFPELPQQATSAVAQHAEKDSAPDAGGRCLPCREAPEARPAAIPSKCQRGPLGINWIRHHLNMKGVKKDLIDQCTEHKAMSASECCFSPLQQQQGIDVCMQGCHMPTSGHDDHEA